MARYTLPPFINRIAGSRQGSVFQKCGSNFCIRSRKRPVDKKNPSQSQNRNRFDSVAKKFKNLSAPQKNSFLVEAPSFARINSLGEVYTLAANTLHNSSNNNLILADLPPLSVMHSPVPFPNPSFNFISVSYAFNSAFFNIATPNIVPAGFVLKLYATPPISGGQNPTAAESRLLKIYQPGDNTINNIFTEYFNLFGDCSNMIGGRIHAIWIFNSIVNGQASPHLTGSGTVNS